jgi:hypothetical protein
LAPCPIIENDVVAADLSMRGDQAVAVANAAKWFDIVVAAA